MRLRRREEPKEPASFEIAIRRPALGFHGPGTSASLKRPILIAAFEGWNDAGEAASYAVRYLENAWGAVPFGEIDGEEFFDYTTVRPETSMQGGERHITWPTTSFAHAAASEGTQDVLIVRSPEPQLRWPTFCEVLIACCRQFDVERVVTLGAYLSEVTHRQATIVNVRKTDPKLEKPDELSLRQTPYEGPTGIVGVLSAALNAAEIPHASLWAGVPCYSLPVAHKAALGLAKRAIEVIGRPADVAELEEEAAEYERRMEELVEEDEAIATYVSRVEEMEEPTEPPSAEGLTDEIERFLRGGRSS